MKVFFGVLFISLLFIPSIQAKDLVFYEGNGCTQDIVFIYGSNKKANHNCKKGGACKGDNDEAKSLLVKEEAKPGTVITVYDSPGGDTTDDYAEIIIGKEGRGEVCVRTFEKSDFWSSGDGRKVKVSYTKKDGLDGKISRVQVSPPAEVDF